MKRALLLVMILIFQGCETTGLSMREVGKNSVSQIVYSIPISDNVNQTMIDKPLRVAVVQVGEASPSKLMIEKLKQSAIIKEVIALPADNYEVQGTFNRTTGKLEGLNNGVMTQTCRLAKQMGANYILIYGGTIDALTEAGWLSILDLATLGFIIPSQRIYVQGSAVGALVDVNTGNLIKMFNAKEDLISQAPGALAQSKQSRLMMTMRDALVRKLGDNFIHELNQGNNDAI